MEALQLIGPISDTGKLLLTILVLGYIISLLVPSAPWLLALVPGRTVPCFWNVITAGYFEEHLLSLAINSVALIGLSSYIERIWGLNEFVKFILIVNAAVGCLTWAIVVLLFIVTRSEGLLYAQIGGAQGLVGALITALKQLLPDIETPVPKIRAKHLPFIFVVGSLLGGVVLDAYDEVPFAVLGVYLAWIYLRFFQVQRDGSFGDRSESFSFTSFFPRLMQPIVEQQSSKAMKLVTSVSSAVTNKGKRPAPAAIPAGAASEEAELGAVELALEHDSEAARARRRNRGLQALHEHLQAQGLDSGGAGAGVCTPALERREEMEQQQQAGGGGGGGIEGIVVSLFSEMEHQGKVPSQEKGEE